MYQLTKDREEKNYVRQYWNHRDVNFIDYLENTPHPTGDFKKIKELILALDSEDLMKDMKTFNNVFEKYQIRGAEIYFLELIKNPERFITNFISDINLNIQEIYQPHNNAALFSVNGTYYSIEAVDGYTEFKKLEACDLFSGIEFNFDHSASTKDLLLMMFDENLSYSQTEKMSKYEALSYVIDLVDTNKYYLYNNEILDFLNTFDINNKKYEKREFINFTPEANEYISSVIGNLPKHNHGKTFDIIKKEFDIKKCFENYYVDITKDKEEVLKRQHEKFSHQICFKEFSLRQLIRKGDVDVERLKEADVKSIRKYAGIQKMKDTKFRQSKCDF
ncbi:hypothetical protein ACQ9ZH_21075 [Pseudomonas chlororaphis]